MPPIRPASCLRAARAVQRSKNTSSVATNQFSTTSRRAGGGGAPHYDPPTGWLWGVKPGEKYEKEGWENIFFYGFYGSLAAFAVAYAFKPDTSYVALLSLLVSGWVAGVSRQSMTIYMSGHRQKPICWGLIADSTAE